VQVVYDKIEARSVVVVGNDLRGARVKGGLRRGIDLGREPPARLSAGLALFVPARLVPRVHARHPFKVGLNVNFHFHSRLMVRPERSGIGIGRISLIGSACP
jgi:hypothetical protein